MRALNPEVRVEAHALRLDAHNAERLCAGHDLILDCSDNFTTKFLLNDLALRTGKPVLFASVYQYEGQLQLVRGDDATACLRCVWPEATRDGLVGNCAEAGVLGPVPGVFGSLQALEALKLLLGLPGLKPDEMLIFDLVTLSTQRLRARRQPECEAHRRAASSAPLPAPDELEVQFSSLADAASAGFAFVDVRDSRERDAEPLPAAALHLPMSKLLTDAATLDLAGRYLLICATGKRSAAAAGLLRSQGFRRMPLAARRTQEPESLRLKRALLLALRVFARVVRFTAPRQRTPPIIPCSSSRANCRPTESSTCAIRRALPSCAQAEHALEQAHAPDGRRMRAQPRGRAFRRTAHGRGSRRTSAMGDFSGAAQAYRRAHACRPRDAQILAALAGVLFDARDYAGARESINASLAIEPRAVNSNRLAGNIDFVERALGRRRRAIPLCRRQRFGSRAGRIRPAHAAGWRRCALASRSPNSCSARPARGGHSRCCCTCAVNTPKKNSSRLSRKVTTATTHNPTPAPTSGSARRCSTSAKRTGRAGNPRWRATTSRRW